MPIEAFREALPTAVAVVCGRRVGFVGFGAIACSLQRLLRPFGCPISAFDPWLTDGELRAAGVEPAGLEELLGRYDVIFVLAAPTAENAALLSRPALERIRSDAVLVLVSRAHLVDFGRAHGARPGGPLQGRDRRLPA